jgi:hypothetical protein
MNVDNVCLCGRTFVTSGALTKHRHTCKRSKTRLSGALSKAREIWQRKKRRIETPEHEFSRITACAGEHVQDSTVTQAASGSDIQIEVRALATALRSA